MNASERLKLAIGKLTQMIAELDKSMAISIPTVKVIAIPKDNADAVPTVESVFNKPQVLAIPKPQVLAIPKDKSVFNFPRDPNKFDNP